MIELTDDEAISLCDYLELNLIDNIRSDPDVDSIEWLRNMTKIWEKCKLVWDAERAKNQRK